MRVVSLTLAALALSAAVAAASVSELTWTDWDGQQVRETRRVRTLPRPLLRRRRRRDPAAPHAARASPAVPRPHAQVCHPTSIQTVSSEAEIVAIVTKAAANKTPVKVFGSGHSFSPIALTGGVMLSLDNMQAVLSHTDSEVVVQAGIRVYQLNAYLEQQGLALVNMGAIAQQSIAGATSTSTHGTGRLLGSMSTQITALRLVLWNGTIITTSATERPDIFAAARVGLGGLGVITQVTLGVVPLFRMERILTPYHLDDLLELVPTLYSTFERMQWYWTPYTTNATLLLRVPTTKPITGCWNQSGYSLLPDWDPLEALLAAATAADGDLTASAEAGRRPIPASDLVSTPFGFDLTPAQRTALETVRARTQARRVAGAGAGAPSPSGPSVTCVDVSYKTLTGQGDDAFKYTEMEFFVPYAESMHALDDFLAFQASVLPQHNASVGLFTGMRYVAADDIVLSPMFQRDIGVISMIVLGNATTTGSPAEFSLYAHGLESIGEKYQGRFHWGKMNYENVTYVTEVYPELDAFLAVRAELDPHGMFLNDYLTRTLGVSPMW